jgi:uncharacterized membrane protein YgcG
MMKILTQRMSLFLLGQFSTDCSRYFCPSSICPTYISKRFCRVYADVCAQTDIPDVSTRDRDYYTTSDNRRPVSKDQASALLKMARSYLKPVSSGGGGGGGGGGGEGGGGDGEEGGDGGEEEEGAAPFNDDDYTEMYNLEVTCVEFVTCVPG